MSSEATSSESSNSTKNNEENLKFPENFNPGIIDPLKRKNILVMLLYSIIPGLGHYFYSEQKKLGLFFFLVGLSVFYCTFKYQMYYLLVAFEVILMLSAIQSVRSYLFRKRYVYLAGVHGWEYRSW